MTTTVMVKEHIQKPGTFSYGLWLFSVVLTLLGFLWMESLQYEGLSDQAGSCPETIRTLTAPEGHYNGVMLATETDVSGPGLELDEEPADN